MSVPMGAMSGTSTRLLTKGIHGHTHGAKDEVDEDGYGGFLAHDNRLHSEPLSHRGYTGFNTQPGDDYPDRWLFPKSTVGLHRPTSSLRALQDEDIQKSEKYISVEIASKLASYSDPIKLILPPSVEEAAVIYVRRKYVVGGRAAEVPERAPAPVAMVREDMREVRLQRFGGDIDFNINSMLKPALFQREMDMKIAAQHAALSEKLNELGYSLLMRDGTNIIDALVRSTGGGIGSKQVMYDNAQRYYKTQIFGALAKFEYPIYNLLATAKKCSAYDVGRAVKSVLILPHGVPELMKYTTTSQMTYIMNGIRQTDKKPITVGVEGGVEMPATSASVYVHIPPARNDFGAAMPIAGKNSLARDVYYQITGFKKDQHYVDLVSGEIKKALENGSVTYKIRTLSAIMAVAGADTGNLLMQYPRTTVSTDASTESGRVALRVYMGAVLKRPDNVLIMNDIAFDGVTEVDAIEADALPAGSGFIEEDAENITQFDSDVKISRINTGYLGNLDHPQLYMKLHGAQVYQPVPEPSIAAGN